MALDGLESLSVDKTPKVDEQSATMAIAIVVPAFDAADWLGACLDSVRRQTYANWRCYVVDDASCDDTSAIVASFERLDSRFRLLRHGKNGGLSAARNTGLREAIEPIVTFLDADDMLVPQSLERRVRALENRWGERHVVGSWAITPQVPEETTPEAAERLRLVGSSLVVDFASSQGECPFNAHGPVLRTEVVRSMGGFDERMRRGAEDWDLWQRILRHGYIFVPAGGVAGVYRQRRASMVRADPSGHLAEARRLLDRADRWARTSPDFVVDPNAAAPLAVLARGERAVARAATYAGIHLASSGDSHAFDHPSFAEFLEPITRAQGERVDFAKAARAGLHRGLGLGISSSRVDETDRERIAAIGRGIERRLVALAVDMAAQPGGDAMGVDVSVHEDEVDLLFVAETAADVAAYEQLVEEGRARGRRIAAVDLDVVKGDEGAADEWQRRGVAVHPFNHVAFGRIGVGSVVVRRPIGPVTRELVEQLACPVIELEASGRALELECNERSQFATDRVVGPGDVPDSAGISYPVKSLQTNYGRLLPKEEGSIDPASRELIASLKNRHLGETVVVVGNGPSLNETPLEKLGGVPTFAVNGIFYAAERFPDPITYYVVEDTSVFRENTQAIKDFETEFKLFPTDYRGAFSDDEVTDRIGFFRMNGGFYGRDTGTVCHPRFSVDAGQRLFCGQSVTIINLQLAFWMGFSRVVLVGMDFSYTIPDDVERKGDLITSRSDDVNHFHPDYFGKGKSWKDPKLDRVLVNYRLAGEMFEAAGREIVNSTIGGNLDVFRRMDLLDAVNVRST